MQNEHAGKALSKRLKMPDERPLLNEDMIDQLRDMAFWAWADGRIFFVNAEACRALGYTRHELLSMSIPDIDLNLTAEKLQEFIGKNKHLGSILIESVFIAKDGRTFPVEISSNYYYLGDREYMVSLCRDISGRKRAEGTLRKDRFILAKSQEVAHVGNWAWNLETGEITGSAENFRVFGYEPGEVNPTLEWVLSRAHPGDREALAGYMEARARDGEKGSIDYRIIKPDGSVRYVNTIVDKAARDRSGKMKWLYGISQDVTSRKNAEEALRESESRLKRTERILYRSQEAGKVGSWHLDLRKNELWWSPETYRICGLPETTKLNYEAFISTIYGEDREAVGRAWKAALAGAPFDIEHRIIAGGRVKWVHEIAVFDFDEHGMPIFGIGTVTDITERKRAEEALELANAYNRSLIEASLDPLLTIAPDGRVTDVNKAMENVTGLSREQLIGTDFSDYFTEPGKAKSGYQKAFKEGSVTDYPLEIRHKDGHVTPVIYNASVYRDEAGHIIGVFAAARDITEQKKIEEARLSLAAIVDSSDDAIIGKTLDGVITSWNAGAAKLYGYSEGEVIGRPITVLSSPDYPDEIPSILERIQHGEHIDHYETVRRRKDGSNIYVSLSVSPIKDSNGRLAGASTITRDITEKKLAGEAIRRASAYNRSLIEASLDPLVTIAPDGTVTDVNKATENITGYPREHLIGTDFSDYFTEPEKAKEGYLKVFQEGSVIDYPLEIRHKDGHSTPVIYNASVYRNEAGKVIGVFAAARDITERRRAEEALRESEEKFKRIFDRIAIGVAMTDERGYLIDCNMAYQELLGYTKEELREKHFIDLTYPGDAERNMELQRQLARGLIDKYNIEKRYIRKDGRLIWVRLTASAIRDRDGSLKNNLAVVEDVTIRKQAEDALREAKDQVELYVDLMGHDINNMNQVSMGFLELARNMIEMDGKLGEENIVLLDKAIDSLRNSSQLIDNVRKLQRERAGLYEPEVLDVGRVIDDAIEHLRSIPGRDIHIVRKPSGTYFVRANSLLKDVFVNLVGNAIKHSRGSLTVSIGLSPVVENGKTYCRVDVADDGPGIPDALKSTLFDRLSLSTTRAKGKGFGLCLIKMLVDDYRGRFWVEDRVPGDHTKGARFVVMLPAVDDQSNITYYTN